jgi:hypothetical protein
MHQHPAPDPDDYEDEEDLEELGTSVYQGSGLTVRELTAEELQRFLDAHQGQPAQLLGSGWAGLDPPASLGVPWTPLAAMQPMAPAGHPPVASAALAAPPWASIGGGARSSWPAGPAAWPGGRR